ncbi:RNA polymerase sigma factor [Erythrobacter sp. YT30]|uniref:RNA polymerase sigma factor n=1 Tax=Erythrobacter sp. YT30 TaxID=1735012 RepID=UPI00076DF120|nr:DUF6596 domain-containing protein [Erythrobacter sp. YT30]KWV93139.1 RNA polymerase subunit sigma-24 [Erythrobacter sp. YT30]
MSAAGLDDKAAALSAARPRVIAALAAHLRDIDRAEDAFADACAAFLESEAEPRSLEAWLITVGKRKAIDAVRRRDAETRAVEAEARIQPKEDDMGEVIAFPDPIPDEPLRLIFVCCHPAIALEARTALALKVLCGLPVAEIARVFVTSEQAMFQRITRAKAKIRDAGIGFAIPERKHWGERLEAVLLTLELAYTVAYQDAAQARDTELAGEVERLALMLAELCPDEPEALGLAALVLLARSRENARVDGGGAMVPLSEQDAQLWDGKRIDRARALLEEAAVMVATGPYQVMASIQLTHARRAFEGGVDWEAVVKLYDALAIMRPSAMVALNRAVAIGQRDGAAAGLTEWEKLPVDQLARSRPYHAAEAELRARLGETDKAARAYKRALELDPAPAEKLFLEARLAALAKR